MPFLSPASCDSVFFNSSNFIIPTTDVQHYHAACQWLEEMLHGFGGKPHWGKFNILDHEQVRCLYGDRLDKFLAVQRQLDPQKVFSNVYTEQRLQ